MTLHFLRSALTFWKPFCACARDARRSSSRRRRRRAAATAPRPCGPRPRARALRATSSASTRGSTGFRHRHYVVRHRKSEMHRARWRWRGWWRRPDWPRCRKLRSTTCSRRWRWFGRLGRRSQTVRPFLPSTATPLSERCCRGEVRSTLPYPEDPDSEGRWCCRCAAHTACRGASRMPLPEAPRGLPTASARAPLSARGSCACWLPGA